MVHNLKLHRSAILDSKLHTGINFHKWVAVVEVISDFHIKFDIKHSKQLFSNEI